MLFGFSGKIDDNILIIDLLFSISSGFIYICNGCVGLAYISRKSYRGK